MRNPVGGAAGAVIRCVVLLVAVAVLVVVGELAGMVDSRPAAACSLAGVGGDFDGTVVAVAGAKVTYRVDRVRRDEPLDTLEVPDPGETLVVRYAEPTDLLVIGTGYRVKGWSAGADEMEAQIAYDFHGDCGTGEGTTALDGSYLEAPSKSVIERWSSAFVVVVVVGGVFVAGFGVRCHVRNAG